VPEYCLVASAFGPVGLLWSERGLVRLALPDVEAPAQDWLLHGIEAAEADPPAALGASIVKLQRYFAGIRTDLTDIPVDLEGVPDFFRALYLEMRLLGWGETVTYGELAARIAAPPGAARAVGQAMGRNPLPVIIPCHRVLASNGRPGGFSAPGGVATKLRLLEMEGVRLTRPSRQLAFAF
jgi:methylated-DNA-[protein]-cysteine S-methyltransferase